MLELEAEAKAWEGERAELGRRVKHLETHLRERERLLVKADKRFQEAVRWAIKSLRR